MRESTKHDSNKNENIVDENNEDDDDDLNRFSDV